MLVWRWLVVPRACESSFEQAGTGPGHVVVATCSGQKKKEGIRMSIWLLTRRNSTPASPSSALRRCYLSTPPSAGHLQRLTMGFQVMIGSGDWALSRHTPCIAPSFVHWGPSLHVRSAQSFATHRRLGPKVGAPTAQTPCHHCGVPQARCRRCAGRRRSVLRSWATCCWSAKRRPRDSGSKSTQAVARWLRSCRHCGTSGRMPRERSKACGSVARSFSKSCDGSAACFQRPRL
mmetsp:Transcript_42688/g.108515  ORF Transcript_42688/g.108515 Transcript_42688/m.108515 type:complete len:233 (+) Transcript_42688:482-1180(+)